MSEKDPETHAPETDASEGSRRGQLIALLVIVVLVVGGIMLTRVLSDVGSTQDCVMSGRTNCAPVQSGNN